MVRYSMIITLLAIAPAVAHARVVRDKRSFLGVDMQPEVVARTLKRVEDEWKAQAALFAECNSSVSSPLVSCQDAPTAFRKSCTTTVNAIVQGSNGDKSVAKEYMQDVCGQSIMDGWHRQKCQSLAAALNTNMSADAYTNRYSFKPSVICETYWAHFLKEERDRMAEEEAAEKAAREAAEKKAAEDEKLAQEAAVKKAAVEAARQKAEDQKAKAKEAAELAAKKRAEAEAAAEAAKQKAAEAAQAVHQHEEANAVAKDAQMKAAEVLVVQAERELDSVNNTVVAQAERELDSVNHTVKA